MIDFVMDKRFLVGLVVGWFVVPYGMRFVTMQRSKMTATNGNGA
jgi:hypothetical protein